MSPKDTRPPPPTNPPPTRPNAPATGKPPAGPKTKSFTDAQLLLLFDAIPVVLSAVLLVSWVVAR